MQIQVTKNKVILPDNYIVNKGEYHVNVLEFLFSEEYTNEMVKKAIFVSKDESIEQVIINNQCHIPNEMLNIKSFELRVYAYEIENGELVLRYSPTYAMVYLREGSYKSDTSSEETITPTQFEQFEQALNNGLNELETGLEEVSNVDIDASKSGNTATVTITDRQGTEKSVEIFDGDDYVITENDYQEIADIVENQINIPTKTSDLTNDDNVVKDASYVHTDNNYSTAEKTKLNGIATGAEVNTIDTIKVNGTAQAITSKAVDITVPTNNNQLTNGAGYQTASDVQSIIDGQISSAYKAKGSIAFASLPALSASVEGFVYNVTDNFTTTSDFVEGAGKAYPSGTNVVIINTTGSTYKYDVLAGIVDLSSYVLASDLVAYTNSEIDSLFN